MSDREDNNSSSNQSDSNTYVERTEKLKWVSLIQKYLFVIVTCIGIGWSSGELLDKLGWI